MHSAQPADTDPHSPNSRHSDRNRHGVSNQFDHEVDHARQVVDTRSGGIIWTGEPGMGKGALLQRLEHELSRSSSDTAPHVIRLSAATISAAAHASEVADIIPTRKQLLAIIGAVPAGRTAVALVDNFDLLATCTQRLLLELASSPSPQFVVLATARTTTLPSNDFRPVDIRELPASTAQHTLEFLRRGHHIDVAPRVASILTRALQGNTGMILETAKQLRPEQRAGTAALPEPLPPTSLVDEVVGTRIAALSDADRHSLLLAALSVTDHTRLLCAAAEMDVDTFIRSPVCEFLSLNSGRFEITDPRVRACVQARATVAERTHAHHRLAKALSEETGDEFAVWHRANAAVEGHAALTNELVALSRRVFLRGDAMWAHDIAREAASHAPSTHALAAEYLAGLTALHSGYVDDAINWLNGVMRSDDFSWAAKALSPFIVAVTYARGYVPSEEVLKFVEELRRRHPVLPGNTSAERGCSDVVAGLILAAGLSAERGNHATASALLDKGEQLGKGLRESTWLVAIARRWCSSFGLELQDDRPLGDAPPALEGYGVLAGALALAGRERWEPSGNLLSGSLLAFAPARRQAGQAGAQAYAATPLLEAHLRVALSLTEAALGRFVSAKTLLEDAAFELPIQLPFAGIGVAALGRYEILVEGSTSATSVSLSQLLTRVDRTALHRDHLVNRAITAAAAGNAGEAAALMSLVSARHNACAESIFDLPMPDEPQLWLAAGDVPAAMDALARIPEHTAHHRAARMRASLALATPDELPALLRRAVRLSLDHPSHFERARLELEIAGARQRLGQEHQARVHRLAAADLSLQSGATTSLGPLQGRVHPGSPQRPTLRQPVRRHNRAAPAPVATASAAAAPVTAPIATVTPLLTAEHPPEWAKLLTERERQIVRLVVEGRTNRDAAQALHVSVRTVETHLGRIFSKLGVHSRTQLAHLTRQGERWLSKSSTT